MLHFVRRPLVSSIILRICVDRGRPFFLLTEGGTIGGSWGRGQCRLSGTGWKSGDVLLSLFMNELYGFQLDNHRWYPLELRKEKSTKDKSKGCKRNERSNDSQDDMEMPLQSEMDDNTEDSEEAAGSQCDVSNVSNHLTKNLSLNAVSSTKVSDAKVQGLIGDCDKQQSTLPEVVKPCGRINSCMVVGKDALYLYGGMMEIKDREITLDDLYSLNLSKLDEWKCIIPASESEWQDISEDEDEEEDEDDDDGTEDDESDDGSDTSEADDDDDDIVCDVNGKKTLDMSTAVSLLKGEKKNLRRKEKRARIEQIRVTLGLSDSQRTPTPGETLRDFYRRTSMYWQMAAHEHTQHTGKAAVFIDNPPDECSQIEETLGSCHTGIEGFYIRSEVRQAGTQQYKGRRGVHPRTYLTRFTLVCKFIVAEHRLSMISRRTSVPDQGVHRQEQQDLWGNKKKYRISNLTKSQMSSLSSLGDISFNTTSKFLRSTFFLSRGNPSRTTTSWGVKRMICGPISNSTLFPMSQDELQHGPV
ncbi:uncharacterized protein LOC109726490 isoform X2 [Ananas comosus]|uniref:Uncharacterized protein LOC109726490 isoform X2 n=1 Tax=Ananas comosus TaxID=4615 RepID=A0A6P5GUX5_ANACO|nr:uncharacterized protein LOC109726490 isoform X2 [Ananas comosus]